MVKGFRYRKTSELATEVREQKVDREVKRNNVYGAQLPSRSTSSGFFRRNATTVDSDCISHYAPSEAASTTSISSFVSRSLRRLGGLGAKGSNNTGSLSKITHISFPVLESTSSLHRLSISPGPEGLAPGSSFEFTRPVPAFNASSASLASRRTLNRPTMRHIPEEIVVISRETAAELDSECSTPDISPTAPNFPDFLRAPVQLPTPEQFPPAAVDAPSCSTASESASPVLSSATSSASLSSSFSRPTSWEAERDECPSLCDEISVDTNSSCGVFSFGHLVDNDYRLPTPVPILALKLKQQVEETGSLPTSPCTPRLLGLTGSFPSPPSRRAQIDSMLEPPEVEGQNVVKLADLTTQIGGNHTIQPDFKSRRAIELFAGEEREVALPVAVHTLDSYMVNRTVAQEFFDQI